MIIFLPDLHENAEMKRTGQLQLIFSDISYSKQTNNVQPDQ